ncbi:MAG TPA: DUF4928 family protein [Candidatus Hydrogenedentes bacterium]|nr:DUF4928 family protein [Candidatus Hydrogenedentota bacterium]HQM48708.1 DUF4928 family protein [Candidatus Hydrogenedentota bacterium]
MTGAREKDATLNQALYDFAAQNGVASKGPLSTVLILTRTVRKMTPPFQENDFLSPKKGQVKGLGGSAIKAILKDYGITQTLSSEGGRTSRGSIGLMAAYVKFLNNLYARSLLDLDKIEPWWIDRVRDFFASKPLKVKIDASTSHRQLVSELMAAALARQEQCPGTMIAGAVMQHLVGAKLSIALPSLTIEHHGSSVADESSGRNSDFCVGDTAIHVTTAPTEHLIQKCCQNLAANLRPLIITVKGGVEGTYLLAKNARVAHRIDVLDIEQFLTTNIYEWTRFQGQQRPISVRDLLKTYNEIVQEFESDPRLLIALG